MKLRGPRQFKRKTPLVQIQIGTELHITLNRREVVMDAEDAHLLEGATLCITTRGYVQLHKKVTTGVYTHHTLSRLILNAPIGRAVDHVSGNQLDNRKVNLRLCSLSENARNRRMERDSTSHFKGVRYANRTGKKRWNARIFHNGARKCLGYYATPQEAGAAYNAAAQELYGEFARINVMSEPGKTVPVKELA